MLNKLLEMGKWEIFFDIKAYKQELCAFIGVHKEYNGHQAYTGKQMFVTDTSLNGLIENIKSPRQS